MDGGLITNEIVAGLVGFCPPEVPIHVDFIRASNNTNDTDFSNNLEVLIRELTLFTSGWDDQVREIEDVCKITKIKRGVLHV